MQLAVHTVPSLSTMFLMGPMAQLKRMFDKGRWVATAVYLASMLSTLLAAYVVRERVVVADENMYQTSTTGSVWAAGPGVPRISAGRADMVQLVIHSICSTGGQWHAQLGNQ